MYANGSLEKRYIAAVSFAVALATVLVYLPALRNDFVNWDDPVNILNNVHIRSLDWGLFKWAATDTSLSYWQPVNWLTHAIDYAVWGLNPVGHHLTSILLHAVATFTVVLLVITLVEFSSRHGVACRSVDGTALLVAGVTGLLFGIHPLNVESVAWVTGRAGILCVLFYMLSVRYYLRHALAISGEPKSGKPADRGRFYLLSLVCFALSLASKQQAITLPVVLVLIDWYGSGGGWGRERVRTSVVRTLPYFLLAAAGSMVAVFSEKLARPADEQMVVSLPDKLLVAAKAICLYLAKSVVPVHLIPYYEYPGNISFPAKEFFLPVLAVCGITVVAAVLLNKQKLWFAVWIYFIVTLLPVLGLVSVRSVYMADRYMYLSIIGPLFLLGLAVGRLWQRYGRSPSGRWSLAVLAAAGVIALAGVTVKQIGVWKSSMSLWSHVIDREPLRNPIAYHNRSLLFADRGDYDRAIDDATLAIALAPDYHDAYHNRGNAFAGKGEFARAIDDYNRAISLKPDDAALYNSLGLAYAGRGMFDQAIASLGKAISLKPDYVEAYNNRGLAYAARGEWASAVIDYDRAGSLQPADASVHINRGIAFAGQGRTDLAEKEYADALALKPSAELAAKAYANRGILRISGGEYDSALADFNAAAELSPDNAALFSNRGALYRLMREYRRAAADYGTALRLDPGLGRAYVDRGEVFLQAGDPVAAKEDFLAACRRGIPLGCSKARALP